LSVNNTSLRVLESHDDLIDQSKVYIFDKFDGIIFVNRILLDYFDLGCASSYILLDFNGVSRSCDCVSIAIGCGSCLRLRRLSRNARNNLSTKLTCRFTFFLRRFLWSRRYFNYNRSCLSVLLNELDVGNIVEKLNLQDSLPVKRMSGSF